MTQRLEKWVDAKSYPRASVPLLISLWLLVFYFSMSNPTLCSDSLSQPTASIVDLLILRVMSFSVSSLPGMDRLKFGDDMSDGSATAEYYC